MGRQQKEPQSLQAAPETDKLEKVPEPAREEQAEGKGRAADDRWRCLVGLFLPPAKAAPDTPIPVRVLITDAEGKPVPVLNFVPDATMQNRYDISLVPGTLKDDLSDRKRVHESPAPEMEAHQGYVDNQSGNRIRRRVRDGSEAFPGGVKAEAAPSKTVVRGAQSQERGRLWQGDFLVGLLLGALICRSPCCFF